MNPDSRDESVRFGPFELKPQSGELLRGGALIKLPPQPFKVLLLLVENAGQLVTRKQLHDKRADLRKKDDEREMARAFRRR